MTPRISSFIAAVCIPVFTVSRDYLPFQRLIPWANISLHVRAKQLLSFYAASKKPDSNHCWQNDSCINPLGFLGDLPDAEVSRMQQALLHPDPRRDDLVEFLGLELA